MTVFFRWRVYLDSNFFIRFVESRDERLLHVFEREAADLLTLHTSELTLAEVLVDPIRAGDLSLTQECREFLSDDQQIDVVPIERSILIRSAEIRATIGNKLPDAIHVATAAARSCNVFLSSDKKLRLLPQMSRVALEDANDPSRWPA